MDISVVIPTYNRKSHLLRLLKDLNKSLCQVREVIIVDASAKKLLPSELASFDRLHVRLINAPYGSVCLQRNMGIRAAKAPWIFLCDDDMQVPADYLENIRRYSVAHPTALAISGQVLQRLSGQWKAYCPITSAKELVLKYIFGLGIWGEIECRQNNWLLRRIKAYYQRKGNHIARSGWPVITELNKMQVTVPVFGMGASVIHKTLLGDTPYDECLDSRGIGDHYGVAADFSGHKIHVISAAHVYHYQAKEDRLGRAVQYYQRVMALDYFISTKKHLNFVSRSRLEWSLLGNLIIYIFQGDRPMAGAALKSLGRIIVHRNCYLQKSGRKVKIGFIRAN